MRPVLEEKKMNYHLWILYVIIFLICIIGIAVTVYLEFYQDENIGLIFGVTDEESEEIDQYNDLKAEITSLFTNKLEKYQDDDFKVEKISDKFDLIATPFTYEKTSENGRKIKCIYSMHKYKKRKTN